MYFSGFLGKILQALALSSLLIPKAILVSVALMVAPYVYLPICLLIELCLIVLLNVPFQGWRPRFETLCCALVPIFFRHSKKEDETEGRLKQWLRMGAFSGQTLLIFFSVGLLVSSVIVGSGCSTAGERRHCYRQMMGLIPTQ